MEELTALTNGMIVHSHYHGRATGIASTARILDQGELFMKASKMKLVETGATQICNADGENRET